MRWLVMLLAALTLLLVVAPARAQAIPSPPASKPTLADEATAKKSFESGLRLYNEGSYAEALIAFEQSYRLGGRPSALKNIAQCHRSLKHFVEAYEALEQMLAKHDAQVAPLDKKGAQQAMEELGVLTATVLVEVNEADADIEIDGKSAGQSPMARPKRVAATGSHAVRVTKAGFAKVEQTFTVDSQQAKKLDVKLEPEKLVGYVVVREQNGRDVHAFVDGQDRGPTPWEGELPIGPHTVEAKSVRYASEARKINVAQRDRLDISLDASPLQGRLRVTTVPATASIAVDGNNVGTGAWEGELPEGPHRIEVSLGGQPPQVREIVLGRGQVVVQEIPIVAAIALGSAPVYEGLWVRFSIFAMIGLGNVPDNSVGPSTSSDGGGFDGAAGATLRVGRHWDWYGAEVVGLFMLEHRDRSYAINGGSMGPTKMVDESNSPNGFIGVGPRVTSKDESVRFTFGIAPGIGIHTFSVDRRYDNSSSGPSGNPGGMSGNRFVQNTGAQSGGGSSQAFGSSGYTAFGFLMDGGILLGSTPGTKFFIGAQAWIDFAPTLVVGPDMKTPIPNSAFTQPGRGVTVVDGAQFFFGPVLGLQFGH